MRYITLFCVQVALYTAVIGKFIKELSGGAVLTVLCVLTFALCALVVGGVAGGGIDDILPASRRGVCRQPTRIGVRILLLFSGATVRTCRQRHLHSTYKGFSAES